MSAFTRRLLALGRQYGGHFRRTVPDQQYFSEAALLALPSHYQRELLALLEAHEDERAGRRRGFASYGRAA